MHTIKFGVYPYVLRVKEYDEVISVAIITIVNKLVGKCCIISRNRIPFFFIGILFIVSYDLINILTRNWFHTIAVLLFYDIQPFHAVIAWA